MIQQWGRNLKRGSHWLHAFLL